MVDGDYFETPNGQLLLIDGSEKANQDLAEALLHSELHNLVGNLPSNGDTVGTGFVSAVLYQVVESLITAQNQDENLTDEERITGVENLTVKQGVSQGDFYYYIEASLASGDVVTAQPYGFQVSIKQAESPNLRDLIDQTIPEANSVR